MTPTCRMHTQAPVRKGLRRRPHAIRRDQARSDLVDKTLELTIGIEPPTAVLMDQHKCALDRTNSEPDELLQFRRGDYVLRAEMVTVARKRRRSRIVEIVG